MKHTWHNVASTLPPKDKWHQRARNVTKLHLMGASGGPRCGAYVVLNPEPVHNAPQADRCRSCLRTIDGK